MRHAKKTAISNKVQEIGTDAGKLYKLVNNVLGRKKDNPLLDGKSTRDLVRSLQSFSWIRYLGLEPN